MSSTVQTTNVVAMASALIPNLRERAQETENLRYIPDATMKEIRDAGLFKMLRPKRYGGLETNLRQYSEAIVEISKGCGSTGWIVALCAIRELMVAESFSEEAHEEIFGNDPESVLFAGVYEPRHCVAKEVDGGYLIEEGFWMFCSGSVHATWGYFGMPVLNEQGEMIDQLLMTLPFSEVEVQDDWKVLGLKGTGSNSVKMKNVFIPKHRCTSFVKALDGEFESTHLRDVPLYHTALFPALILSLGLTGLGLLKNGLEFFQQTLPNRRAGHIGVEYLKDAASIHTLIADAALKIETAEYFFYKVADDLDQWASKKQYMDRHTRVKALADIGYANQLLKEALDLIVAGSGSSFAYDGHPLQRIIRDFQVLHSHRSLSPSITRENYGRTLVGLESNASRY